MKVTVERAQLLKSLGHVHRVVERRNTIPILGNVLVRAEKAKLSLKATDLDLEVTETLAAETGSDGSTTVPAHMFYDIVRKLPEGTIEGHPGHGKGSDSHNQDGCALGGHRHPDPHLSQDARDLRPLLHQDRQGVGAGREL